MPKSFWLIGIGVLVLTSAPLRAADDDMLSDDWGNESALQQAFQENSSPQNYKWELGLDVSYEKYASANDATAIVDVDKVQELNEERADLGLAPVPAGSTDKVIGHPRSTWEVGAHLYRQIGPLISVGVIGGYGIEHNMTLVDQGTAIAAPMYSIDYSRLIYYVAPSVKIGYWINRFRPYIIGGVGDYTIRERTQAKLVFDPFNDFSVGGPFTTSDTTNSYAGIHFGTGVDVHVGGNGVIGAEIRYQRILKPGDPISLVSPGLRFSYLF